MRMEFGPVLCVFLAKIHEYGEALDKRGTKEMRTKNPKFQVLTHSCFQIFSTSLIHIHGLFLALSFEYKNLQKPSHHQELSFKFFSQVLVSSGKPSLRLGGRPSRVNIYLHPSICHAQKCARC